MEMVSIMKFGRVLLSEYNTSYGLANHADYKSLKEVVHELQVLPTSEVLAVCEEKFFSKVTVEMGRVMEFTKTKEKSIATELFRLQGSNVSDLVGKEPEIIELYIHLHMLNSYRKLNFFGLKKLLEKFTKRCAMKSISLQTMCDQKYNEVCDMLQAGSDLDIAEGMDFLTKVLMQVPNSKRRNYEDACTVLESAAQRDYRCRPRIIDNTMAAFFRRNKIPRKECTYHLRVLSGNTNPRLAHDVETLLKKANDAQPCVKVCQWGVRRFRHRERPRR
jgi:hypothetical protein